MEQNSVLIIEDRPEIMARLERAVRATPTLTLIGACGTVDEGLRLLYERKPRVVLVDLGLPDGSGIEIVTATAQADWTADALVVSIFGDETRVFEAIKAGARGYLLKGADLAEVSDSILSLLDGGSPISPAIARHVLNMLSTQTAEPQLQDASALTNREAEILRRVARGYKRHEIADSLGISPGTVGNHITAIYRKLEVGSNIEAVARATRIGLL